MRPAKLQHDCIGLTWFSMLMQPAGQLCVAATDAQATVRCPNSVPLPNFAIRHCASAFAAAANK